MSGSEIRPCPGCKDHPFQDERYNTDENGRPTGRRMRVHNIGEAHSVCTICSGKKELKKS
jgi:hypothetical protein